MTLSAMPRDHFDERLTDVARRDAVIGLQCLVHVAQLAANDDREQHQHERDAGRDHGVFHVRGGLVTSQKSEPTKVPHQFLGR